MVALAVAAAVVATALAASRAMHAARRASASRPAEAALAVVGALPMLLPWPSAAVLRRRRRPVRSDRKHVTRAIELFRLKTGIVVKFVSKDYNSPLNLYFYSDIINFRFYSSVAVT